jgi:hypothetical protein
MPIGLVHNGAPGKITQLSVDLRVIRHVAAGDRATPPGLAHAGMVGPSVTGERPGLLPDVAHVSVLAAIDFSAIRNPSSGRCGAGLKQDPRKPYA